MYRTIQKDLEYLVNRINMLTNSPIATCTKRIDDRGPVFGHQYSWNIGNYHLDYAYGGVKLIRTCNSSGGVSIISNGGYETKRALYNWMQAFLTGLKHNRS